MRVVIGWDVGGAHLEAARAARKAVASSRRFKSPRRSGSASPGSTRHFGPPGSPDAHAVTMTGELSMSFASRSEGVAALAALTASALAPAALRFYAGRAGFLSLDAVGAALLARCCREALL